MTVGHIAENCTSQERLCYNCRKPGHESSACTEPRTVAAKQCYSCGGIGHIQAECPTLRLQGSNQKCYVRPSPVRVECRR
jgi:cellular nucleic acid-binding protein